jgi:hypothetical protein
MITCSCKLRKKIPLYVGLGKGRLPVHPVGDSRGHLVLPGIYGMYSNGNSRENPGLSKPRQQKLLFKKIACFWLRLYFTSCSSPVVRTSDRRVYVYIAIVLFDSQVLDFFTLYVGEVAY